MKNKRVSVTVEIDGNIITLENPNPWWGSNPVYNGYEAEKALIELAAQARNLLEAHYGKLDSGKYL